MNILTECGPSRWTDFLTIPDDAMPTHSGEDFDLFVGRSQIARITIKNGTEVTFRDVVVLGKLIIESSDPENTAIKPKLITRDFFSAGDLSINNISLTGRNFYTAKNIDTFTGELQELLMGWLAVQREAVTRIGLKSILM